LASNSNGFRTIGRCALIAVLTVLGQSPANADDWPDKPSLVYAGHLIRAAGRPAEKDRTLVLSKGRISAIHEGLLTPAELGLTGAKPRIVDLRSAYVLPGLIDLHVHLTTIVEPGEALRTVTLNSADLALIARNNALKTVRAGVTTVVDLGTGRKAHEAAIFALRDAISAGRVSGPRILAAGSPISPTGASRTARFAPAVNGALEPQGVCNGADDCRRAVREQVKRGADVINFYNSGSLNDAFLAPQTLTAEEMSAIVETAHSLGRKVVADGHTAKGVNMALRAGADIVDTVPWPDDETWRLLHSTGAVFVPHLQAFRVSFAQLPPVRRKNEPPVFERLRELQKRPLSAERAREEGVPMALGSDPGIIRHGDNARDLEDMVAMGMSPAEALAAATTTGARALGLERHIGALEVGMSADMIAVDTDPQQDITAIRNIRAVMVRGRLQP